MKKYHFSWYSIVLTKICFVYNVNDVIKSLLEFIRHLRRTP